MFKLFNNSKNLEKKGYLLVVVFDNKEKCTTNCIFDREKKSFEKTKVFNIASIESSSYFPSVTDAINEVSEKKEYKRFLAGHNVTGIYYVEMEVKQKGKNNFVISDNVYNLFYVPSKMQLNLVKKNK